ncbi:MAG: hypothetical protein KGM17_12685 [Sphingomonadales bacterium]|nr:hypothetical protein [Sphingomonadales bacterium]
MKSKFVSFGSVSFGRRVAQAALAIALVAGTPVLAKDKEQPAKAEANSPDFVKAAGPLQKTLADAQPLIKKYQAAPDKAGKDAAMAELKTAFAAAPAQFQAAEAAAKNGTDKSVVGQWGVMIAAVLNDNKLAQRALQDVVDSGKGTPAEQASNQFKLGVSAYQNQDYATAIKALTPVVAANYSDDVAAEALALSYTNQGQTAEALNALKVAAQARKAAGGTVPSQWLLRANQIAYKAKNPTLGNEWAILTVDYAPTPANWISSAQLLRIYNGYTGQEALDLARLLSRSGALAGSPKEARQEYLDYISTADARRQPGEVLAAIDAATASGALAASDPAVVDARNLANQRLAADKASLPALYTQSHGAAASAAVVAGTADAYLGYGDSAKAAELYKIALTKPGVDSARVLTRLGIAQLDAGDAAAALDSFGKVTGPRAPLAQFWAVYARQKAGAK